MAMLTSVDTQVRIGGTSISFTDEPLATTNNLIYKIVDRNKSVWNMSEILTVTGIDVDDSYRVDWANGFVQFDKPQIREGLLVSGKYLTTTSIGRITSYDYSKNRDFMKVNFMGALHPEEIPLGESTTGSIEALEIGDSYFLDAFNDAEQLLLEFQFGDFVDKLWVYIESHGTSHSGNELVKNNIQFRGIKE